MSKISVIIPCYNAEKYINIIANNYVVRKMCYPIFCIPILKLMLFLRMLKHEYYFNGYSSMWIWL